MYAISLLGSVRQVEHTGRRLLDLRTFSLRDTEPKLLETVTTLVDIAELLRANTPFPLAQHTRQIDSVVSQILRKRYERLSASPADFADDIVETARTEAGIEAGESWLVVPLDGHGIHAKNWQPVFSLVQDRVSEILSDFERIRHRLEVSGSGLRLVETCRTVVEMLGTLATTLDRIIASKGYVTYRTDHRQDELLDAIERKTTAFTGDTDA